MSGILGPPPSPPPGVRKKLWGSQTPRSMASLDTTWDVHADTGSSARRTRDLERPAQVVDALAHRMQSQVARICDRCIETRTIIPYFHHNTIGSLFQAQYY